MRDSIVEYTGGENDPKFVQLTSMLHYRPDLGTVTEADLDNIYNLVFSTEEKISGGKPIMDLIQEQAATCLNASAGANFENKIVLAIATRLAAERFMVKRIADDTFVASIPGHQTQTLTEKFRKLFDGDAAIESLDRVVLITPENIHLNSFMYEPIVDMSDEQLRKLYREVLALN